MKKWANELNRNFSKEEIQLPNKYTKKCLTALAKKEMQIKIMLSFHLTPIRTAFIKSTNNNKRW
jgi:hypothetical protein